MTMIPRLSDALAAARQAATRRTSAGDAAMPASATPPAMAPLAMTPLAPPRVAGTDECALPEHPTSLPGAIPTARRELFERTRDTLLELVSRRDVGALPPSWAGVSGRLSQEEAASAAAALQLVAAQVMP